jgi:hypothetical protein
VQILGKCGSILPLPHTPSWRSALFLELRENFNFFTLFVLHTKYIGY